MYYELKEIKVLRKKFNLTQGELAKRANVSQSLIAKIEAGILDPTYTKTVRIFSVLEQLKTKYMVSAEKIMNKKIIPIELTDTVKNTIKKMKKYEISQMPVLENERVVGLVSESAIIKKMAEMDDPERLAALSVKEVMEECPPIIVKTATTSVISGLLTHYPVLLVAENGKLTGLITKSDMLNALSG